MTNQGEGQEMEISYKMQVHRDLLIYPQAFMEVPEMKVQQPIHQMEPDHLRLWGQHYLDQESLGEIADIRGLRRDSSDEDSDSQAMASTNADWQSEQSGCVSFRNKWDCGPL